MKKMITVICCMLALVLSLTACGQVAAPTEGISLAQGGTLVLRVNPEIAVEYDEAGTVTGVIARNDDALAIIAACEGLIGKSTRDVVTDLVTAIGDAGYFVEEIEGKRRQITLEIEPGSSLPSDTFLNEVIDDVRTYISNHDWSTPLVVEGDVEFGVTDYNDTDYGPNADGITDYDDTDYGPNADGITDYDDTDYGPNADGITDYDDTDYGPNADGITDYDDGRTDYDDGKTDYDDGKTDYDDGKTDYNDATDYGDSDYHARR